MNSDESSSGKAINGENETFIFDFHPSKEGIVLAVFVSPAIGNLLV